MTFRLVKGIIVFLIYMVLRLFHLYSRLNRYEALRNLELTYIVPFKYVFLARLGEEYTIESSLFRRYYDVLPLSPNSIIIDIGAHIGTFTVRAYKRIAGKSLIIAIEPEPRNMQYLCINLNINKCRSVKVIRAACGDKDGYGFYTYTISRVTVCTFIQKEKYS